VHDQSDDCNSKKEVRNTNPKLSTIKAQSSQKLAIVGLEGLA